MQLATIDTDFVLRGLIMQTDGALRLLRNAQARSRVSWRPFIRGVPEASAHTGHCDLPSRAQSCDCPSTRRSSLCGSLSVWPRARVPCVGEFSTPLSASGDQTRRQRSSRAYAVFFARSAA